MANITVGSTTYTLSDELLATFESYADTQEGPIGKAAVLRLVKEQGTDSYRRTQMAMWLSVWRKMIPKDVTPVTTGCDRKTVGDYAIAGQTLRKLERAGA